MHKPSCFEACLEVASECENCCVVHAWLKRPEGFAVHAWGENDSTVYDLTQTRAPLSKAQYYADNSVQESHVKRYGRVEFFTLFADTKSVGPFDKEFFFATTSENDPVKI